MQLNLLSLSQGSKMGIQLKQSGRRVESGGVLEASGTSNVSLLAREGNLGVPLILWIGQACITTDSALVINNNYRLYLSGV